MNRLSGKLTYANVVGTLALFLVLAGGTAFAATQMLPKNSVGSGQLKKGAVTPSKLSKSAQSKLVGPRGAQGSQGTQGPRGIPGEAGQNLTAETTLPSGKTETGIFAAAGSGAPGFLVGTATFVQPIPARFDATHVIQLVAGEASAPHCPGVGRADPGYFCVYPTEELHTTSDGPPEDPGDGLAGAGKDGAQFFFTIIGSGGSAAYGTWAVTAP